MISAFFIFNQKGEVLISRLYRPDFKRSIADVFRIQVVSNSDVRSPIITLGSTSFFHVRINNLYVVAVTKTNANAALVFEFCYRFINICKSYFGKIDEESIKNNFTMVYELIDEICDFGFPQNSEIDTLKSYITTESVVSQGIPADESSKITVQATGAISWRRADVKYKKNEAFVDVIETVNLSMSAKGNILRAEVDGHIMMRAYLSGTPECKFGLNDKLVIDKSQQGGGGGDAVELDDCRFHQCVRLNEFDAARTISFIPPDGEFELMKYRSTSNVKIPLRVIPTVTEVGTTQVTYDIIIKTNFSNKLAATNVVLRIPTPLNTTTVDCKVGNGKAKYAPSENVVVWKIPRIQGGQECTFSAIASLTTSVTNRQVWARPPIDVDFQVLMFTSSGLIVRFLKVFEKSNYQSVKWVRYLTKASGGYQIRSTDVDDTQLNTRALFGFNQASSIDSLLDKDDVALEALLDEDDLLQECKAQNTRLIEYFGRGDVLKKLLGYVTGQTESEEKGRFKYPYIATEVLCSEIWSIIETCMREQDHLLVPFWETVLDRPPEEMKTQMIMASHFSKINSTFLTKKPEEMIAFLQAQPDVVDRILQHIETSPFVDLLVRIIQLDEHASGNGVLEWLSSQNFIGRLIDLLSPKHSTEVHSIVTDLIKGIISMATPSPAAGITDDSSGPASNRFARELAKWETITKLLSFMLCDFDSVPNRDNATSSVVHSIAVVIELIRKNNSDYFEPYLFHTLRNRLIHVQQQVHAQGEDSRTVLEETMKEMVNRMGVVHLGPVLELMCEHLDRFHELLTKPRSLQGPIQTTVGSITPLTLERYRILELLAELLHCSNMSLLNRPAEYSHLYDSEGRLQGGLSALEELASVIAMNNANEREQDHTDDDEDEVTPARDFPVRAPTQDSPSLDSDDDMDEPGSSDDDEMEEIAMYDEPQGLDNIFSPSPSSSTPSSLNSTNLPPSPSPFNAETSSIDSNSSGGSSSGTATGTSSSPLTPGERPSRRLSARSIRSMGSRRSSRRRHTMDNSVEIKLPIGEQLKKQFLEMNLFGTLLDLFFEFPWNNFLHSAVYDLIHQVLTGNVDTGRNRELAISLFRDAKIMHRIVEGQARNDNDTALTKGGRLGYMGHLTLIAEDVITALEHFPPELRLLIIQYAPEDEWDRYVTGRYTETKANDTRLLGGGKPIVASRNVSQWKVDEDELASGGGAGAGNGVGAGAAGAASSGTKSEFRRVGGAGGGEGGPRNTAHFLPESIEEEEEDDDDDDDDDEDSTRAAHFARYLEQEMHSSADQFNSSDDDDDDDDEGWLSQSTFGLRNPPVSALHQGTERRPLGTSGFDDAFDPGSNLASDSNTLRVSNDDDEDDGFGPFSTTPGGVGGSDTFNFSSSSLSEDMDDASFDNFGDFGDFQSAEDTFASPAAFGAATASPGFGSVLGSGGGGGGGGGGMAESWTTVFGTSPPSIISNSNAANGGGGGTGRSSRTSTTSDSVASLDSFDSEAFTSVSPPTPTSSLHMLPGESSSSSKKV